MEQPVIKQSTAENRPPPTQSAKTPQPQQQQPQPSTMPASKPVVSSKKSSSGSPWKTPPVEQGSTQV